jgi:hypothetical protein
MAMSDRERKMVTFGGGGLAVFLILYFLIPALFSDGPATGTIGKERSDLETIMRLYKDFSNVQSEYSKIEKKINTRGMFSLLTELESLAKDAEISSHIESMESKTKSKNEYFKEEAVDIRLFKITLKQLISFMYSIEFSPKVLRVKRLHVEVTANNADLMNVELEVATFKPLK